MARAQYVHAVVSAVDDRVRQVVAGRIGGVTQAVARLERDRDLVIVFTLLERPDVRYGYRIEAVPEEGADAWSPGGWAGVVMANWREAFDAADAKLPSEESEHIVWLAD